MEKAILGFCIYKIWQILKHFAGVLKVENKPLISEECLFISNQKLLFILFIISYTYLHIM